MKLSDWARKEGIQYVTAWRMWRSNKIPYPTKQLPTGTIIVSCEERSIANDHTVIYGRVSSPSKKEDLSRQLERCRTFCLANGWIIEHEYKEIASGLNDKRKVLNKILSNPPKRLVVEHKDRLTRFGFNYIEVLLNKLGCEVVVINRDFIEETDLIKDMIAIITSFCCRLYGLRRGRSKGRQIKETISSD